MSGFRLEDDGFYRFNGLDQHWFDHGFGTRHTSATPEPVAFAKQIHSAFVLTAVDSGLQGEGDALTTPVPDLAVAIKTADCVPILLADPATRNVAAVHAGWRGTAAQIVQRTIEKLGSDPKTIIALLGPSIGPCCFEVGQEVVEVLLPWLPKRPPQGKAFVDLPEVNRTQLLAIGVSKNNIHYLRLCTASQDLQFFSFRKERETAGRMVSYIRIKPHQNKTRTRSLDRARV